MKKYFVIIFIFISVVLYATDKSIDVDSLSNTKIISAQDKDLVMLFPEYPGFEQARLYEIDSNNYYFEIIYRKNNELMVDRYNLSLAQLEELRNKIRFEKKVGLEGYPKASENQPLREKDEGRLRFIWGYSTLTLSMYGISVPSSLELDGPQAVGSYMLLSGSAITLLITGSKDKDITYGEANLSLNYAMRGILHGALLFDPIITIENDEDMLAFMSMVSLIEGTVAFKYAKSQCLTEGQADAIPLYHDFMMGVGLGILFANDIDNIKYGKINATLLISAIAGTDMGMQRCKAIDFTPGDVNGARTNWLLHGYTGLTLGALTDANQTITSLLFIACSMSGIEMGEDLAREYNLKASEGYYLALSTTAGGLVGIGLSLLGQNEDHSYIKSNMLLSTLGAHAGYYLYKRSLTRNTTYKSEKKSKSKLSMDSYINPMAYNSNQPILNLSIKF